jgi:hypothetical protein
MADAANYILLTTSNSGISKKFRVLAGGYNELFQKTGSAERTAEGGLDITTGGVYDVREYSIRVRHTEEDSSYGTLWELRDLYKLNNPQGTPTNVLKFRDHYYAVPESSEMPVVIQGDFQKSIIGYALSGVNAWFVIKLRLLVLPPKRLMPSDAYIALSFDAPSLVVDLTVNDASIAVAFDEPTLVVP